eukprot:gene23684-9224_t
MSDATAFYISQTATNVGTSVSWSIVSGAPTGTTLTNTSTTGATLNIAKVVGKYAIVVRATGGNAVAATATYSVTITNVVARYDHYSSDWGTTAPDISGNNRTLTFNSAPATDSTTDVTVFRASLLTSAIIGTSTTFTTNLSSGWTVETTFMVTSAVTDSPTVWQGPMGRLQLTQNGFYLWDGSGSFFNYNTSGIVLNRWYTVVLLSTGTFYVNGTSYSATGTPKSLGIVSNAKISIGLQGNSTDLTFAGKIASLTMMNMVDLAFASSANSLRIAGVYPPAAMTNDTTAFSGLTYGNGTYTVSMSTVYANGYETYRAFDSNTGTFSATGQFYNVTTGAYTGTKSTTVSGTVYNGEWIQMQFPTSFTLKGYVIWALDNNTRPMSWVMCGSTNNST